VAPTPANRRDGYMLEIRTPSTLINLA